MRPSWPTSAGQWVKLVGNVVNLSTPVGLVVVKLGGATIQRGPRGLFLGEGYRLKFPIAGAFTIGNVVTTASTWEAMLTRWPQLLEHEERHSWQYLACLGLPFYPAYLMAMGWSMLRTGDRSARNFFERDAGLEIGGYRDHPVRPFGPVMVGWLAGLRHRLGLAHAREGSGVDPQVDPEPLG